MVDVVQERRSLTERIENGQRELRKIDPRNELLDMVNVGPDETSYTEAFGNKYVGKTIIEALKTYADDLEKEYKR